MRFQDAAPDARAIVYAGIQADPLVARAADLLAGASLEQRILARAVMNGETTDAAEWRAMFPGLFGPGAADEPTRAISEAVLEASLEVADRGEQVRSQFRGAIVEALTERLLKRAVPAATSAAVRRERRILFDGVRAEIHPYDVTVEIEGSAAAIDCKWGARGISADVLHQLDDARQHAADDDERLAVALVVFDAARSCDVRLDRQTAPHDATRVIGLEDLDALARPGALASGGSGG
ncbi:MAG TPA: hypothetical protein VFV72_04315 [Candidatus Limnocylindrales bacterium]|nr:hypothetical protein [Candidatus Limnocylindrales bacterium]